jgi:mono/diheme cytochrome c family protein
MMRHSGPFMIFLAATAFAGVVGIAGAADPAKDEWKVPTYAANKKNPVPSDDKSIAAGKENYITNCMACHGAGGKGDGPAAPALEHPPGDLTSAKAQEQSDGAIFWKVTTGRKPMPQAPKELTETQRWEIVNYVRTFAPKPAK